MWLHQIADKLNRTLGHWRWLGRSLFPLSNGLCRYTLDKDLRFDYPFDSAIGRALFNPAPFEAQEIRFLKDVLKPGMIFVDVGANGGMFSLIASRRVGDKGRVYAFEPGPDEFRLLEHNLAINGLENVTTINFALSDQEGVSKFAVASDGAFNSLSRNVFHEKIMTKWIDVETTTIDSYVKRIGIDHVNVLKIDVEGAELLVVKGAEMLLASPALQVIMCEFSDLTTTGFGYSTSQLWDFIEDRGFVWHEYNSFTRHWEKAVRQTGYHYANLVAWRNQGV